MIILQNIHVHGGSLFDVVVVDFDGFGAAELGVGNFGVGETIEPAVHADEGAFADLLEAGVGRHEVHEVFLSGAVMEWGGGGGRLDSE